jgi:flavin reductase (DIM6/NTAB) family NADH-FMN oxidoreductase RutF
MAIKMLPPLPEDQVEVDDDRARWPCFFPSSAGMITTWVEPGIPNLMPCGSTTIISRSPLIIAPCISYAPINQRYAPRATLDIIRATGRFGCGVPQISDQVINGITFGGNVSVREFPDKVARSGLSVLDDAWAPILSDLPIHYDCEVLEEILLGTHVMFLGEVKRIRVRSDVNPANPIEWIPWANVAHSA